MMEKYSHEKLVMFFESFLVACTASFIELVKVWIVFICNAKLVMQLVYIALQEIEIFSKLCKLATKKIERVL